MACPYWTVIHPHVKPLTDVGWRPFPAPVPPRNSDAPARFDVLTDGDKAL